MSGPEPTAHAGPVAAGTTAPAAGAPVPGSSTLAGLGGLVDLGGLEPLGDAAAGVCIDGVCAVPGVVPPAAAPPE
ncbi:hypothetical protein [Georgenia thermotolerans]|uniref:Uncharacterized protein n=1 Tax=Georgenia thermotolerans TaxID=527326 RepID=A0A7J5UJG5_9MICO|nr:hypothetical protein [Georgenia thermotolerans]KAE8762304.1 hypothetical protein GB883_20055 [Georgenia thermotolerans]